MSGGLEELFHILDLDERSVTLGEVISSRTGSSIVKALFNHTSRMGLSASEISSMVEAPRTTVLHHLYKLLGVGIVEVNPILASGGDWRDFWNRVRMIGLSKSEVERLRRAKLSGEKLFVPRKMGIMLIPERYREEIVKTIKPIMRLTPVMGSAIGLAGLAIMMIGLLNRTENVMLAEEAAKASRAPLQLLSPIVILGLTFIFASVIINLSTSIISFIRRRKLA